MFHRLSLSLIAVSLSITLCAGTQLTRAETLPLEIAKTRTQRAMVVSANALATDAGVTMLKEGGNAVDAAVATAFAISVVEPFSAGIGGGGFLLLREAKTGKISALDFRERAPQAATKDMYLDENGEVIPRASLDGHLAVGVPGTVAGLYEVHRKYGQLPWETVVAPAIHLANEGFRVGESYVRFAGFRQEVLLKNPAAKAIFTNNGEPYQVGDRLLQSDLGKTLQQVAANWQNFYTGAIAEAIADDMVENGGLITQEDLKAYQPIWREPICGLFLELRVCSMPPPSSGGVHLLQILNIITAQPSETTQTIESWPAKHPQALHLLASAMQIAYADRSLYLGDPDFVEVPVKQIVSPTYAEQRRQEIDLTRVRSQNEVQPVD